MKFITLTIVCLLIVLVSVGTLTTINTIKHPRPYLDFVREQPSHLKDIIEGYVFVRDSSTLYKGYGSSEIVVGGAWGGHGNCEEDC